MNHILLLPSELDSRQNTAVVTGAKAEHIRRQLKAVVGDSIKVGVLGGLCGAASITACDDRTITLAVNAVTPPPTPSPVTLMLAMPRPKVLRRVLRSAIEHGVKQIHLLHTWKVEKSYWQTPWLAAEQLYAINLEALSIAKDTQPATIHMHRRFKPFVEDDLPTLVAGQTAYVAHPSDTACPSNVSHPTWLALGPEGGFTDYEVDMLSQRGFTPVGLGERILRVENAVSAALGRLNPIL